MDKYKIGTRVRYNDFYGIVINNVKLPGDICVDWEMVKSFPMTQSGWMKMSKSHDQSWSNKEKQWNVS